MSVPASWGIGLFFSQAPVQAAVSLEFQGLLPLRSAGLRNASGLVALLPGFAGNEGSEQLQGWVK